MGTKNVSEVVYRRTGMNETRERVLVLERECEKMKYETWKVKTKRSDLI